MSNEEVQTQGSAVTPRSSPFLASKDPVFCHSLPLTKKTRRELTERWLDVQSDLLLLLSLPSDKMKADEFIARANLSTSLRALATAEGSDWAETLAEELTALELSLKLLIRGTGQLEDRYNVENWLHPFVPNEQPVYSPTLIAHWIQQSWLDDAPNKTKFVPKPHRL